MASESKLAVLRNSREIASIRKDGKSFSNRYLVLITQANPGESYGFALIASRTVGGAVERNRCKRRMRSRVSKLEGRIRQDVSFILVARPDLLSVDANTLDKSFNQLFFKAGLIQTDE